MATNETKVLPPEPTEAILAAMNFVHDFEAVRCYRAIRAAAPAVTGDPDMPDLSLCSFQYLADEMRKRGATVTPAPHGGDFAKEQE